jgi:hypothetical protein
MNRRFVVAVASGSIGVVGLATGLTMLLRSNPPAPHAAVHVPQAGVVVTPTPTPTPTPAPTPSWTVGAPLPRTLQNIDLHAAYGAVPLHFVAPTVGIDVPVIGVGLTKTNNVDAPEGPRNSPLWDQGFWYRGGAEPGQPGVLALAGHVDRVGGAAAAFANLHSLKPGDVVQVTDQRSGTVYRYRITEAASYTLKQVEQQSLLDRIYGHDVAGGFPPAVPADLTARISLITCIGTWTGAQYDHRFVALGDLIGTE